MNLCDLLVTNFHYLRIKSNNNQISKTLFNNLLYILIIGKLVFVNVASLNVRTLFDIIHDTMQLTLRKFKFDDNLRPTSKRKSCTCKVIIAH